MHRKPPAPQGSGERRGGTGAPKTQGEPRFKRLPQAPRAPSPLAGGLPGIAHVSPKDGAVPPCLRSFQAAREAGGTRGCPSPSGPGPRARVLLRFQTAAGHPGSSRVTDADEAAWVPPVPSLLLQGRPSWACGGPGSKQAARLGSCSCVRPRCPRSRADPGRQGTPGDGTRRRERAGPAFRVCGRSLSRRWCSLINRRNLILMQFTWYSFTERKQVMTFQQT